jgi:hypothetical protein
MKVSAFIIWIFLINYGELSCQNANEDFTKVNSNLLAAKNLLIETEYRVYPNHSSKQAKEISHGVLKQKGDKIYQSISTLQSLVNEKISIHIDTSDKILVLADPINIDEQKKQALQFDLKDMLDKCKSVTYREEKKGVGIYQLEYKEDINTEFDRCEIFIDKKTFFVTKLIIYYNHVLDSDDDILEGKEESPRLEITFTKIDASPKFKDSIFDEDRFIERKGGKILAASAYKDFKIIDNRYKSRPSN